MPGHKYRELNIVIVHEENPSNLEDTEEDWGPVKTSPGEEDMLFMALVSLN